MHIKIFFKSLICNNFSKLLIDPHQKKKKKITYSNRPYCLTFLFSKLLFFYSVDYENFDVCYLKPSGVGNHNLLQYSCLENSMNREAWWATVVHGVTGSWARVTD